MLASRSVMHYFGRCGQDLFLSSLRSIANKDELFIQQPACSGTIKERDCMNEIYPMMGVDKSYMTVDELVGAYERCGWKVENVLQAPSLYLNSEELTERYSLSKDTIRRICEVIDRYGLNRTSSKWGRIGSHIRSPIGSSSPMRNEPPPRTFPLFNDQVADLAIPEITTILRSGQHIYVLDQRRARSYSYRSDLSSLSNGPLSLRSPVYRAL